MQFPPGLVGPVVTQVFAAVELHAKQRKKAKQIRYNTILAYMKQIVDKKYDSIKDKPGLNTAVGLLKSDLLAIVSTPAHVLDTQVVSKHVKLNVAHKSKVEKYEPLDNAIKHRYDVTSVSRSTATLSFRGIWSEASANDLVARGIQNKNEVKISSVRVLVRGLSPYWCFNRTTS